MYGNGAGTGTVVVRLLAGRQIRKVRHSVPAVYYEAEAGTSVQSRLLVLGETSTFLSTAASSWAYG